jgi:predicted Zn-dependent peptidase
MAVVVSLVSAVLVSWGGAQVPNWPAEAPPRPLPAREVQFPPYEIRTLPNGLQVVVVMHDEMPILTLRMLVRAGSVYDPRGKGGLASMAAVLLDQGTTTRSPGRSPTRSTRSAAPSARARGRISPSPTCSS